MRRVGELGAGNALGQLTPDWPAPPGVRAAFTLRTGGVSAAPYDSLNVGAHVGDVLDAVVENRRRVREGLRVPAEPVWLQQVHGIDVLDLDALDADVMVVERGRDDAGRDGAEGPREAGPREAGGSVRAAVGAVRADAREQSAAPGGRGRADVAVSEPPRADAAVARAVGTVCVIQVADCMPVLFAARDGSAVGAAHAGWRGLAGGVLERTVRALGVAPERLIAWLGPTISQQHFEVGDEVRAAFVSGDSASESAFVANARGRWQCDLYALARLRLAALGVRDVFGGGWCTYADTSRFFSYRRDGQCGRMAALIWRE